MRIIGIDVGLSGGVAFIDKDSGHRTFDMPVYVMTTKTKLKRRKLDERGFLNLMKEIINYPRSKDKHGFSDPTVTIFLERQQPYQKQGVISTFNLGAQYGFIRGVLTSLEVPFDTIQPQTWQKEFSIVKQPNTKLASYEKASALFPNAMLKTERGRILDGHCDALLIAEWGRRKTI